MTGARMNESLSWDTVIESEEFKAFERWFIVTPWWWMWVRYKICRVIKCPMCRVATMRNKEGIVHG